MKTEIGEYIVGAYLSQVLDCNYVQYNVRAPGGGIKGLNELDVVGFRLQAGEAILCEVTTHITGLLVGDFKKTILKIRRKHEWQKMYATQYLAQFSVRYMYWSPVVNSAYLKTELKKLSDEGLEIIINGRYSACVEEMRQQARKVSCDVGNPFFRTLQILERLKSPTLNEDSNTVGQGTIS